mgnify:FL=1
MKLSDLNELDFENIGSWPQPAKVGFIVIVCAAIMGLGFWKDIRKLKEELARVQRQESELISTLEARQRKAANLDALRAQLSDIQATFGDLLRRLPNRTEVPDLLVDITKEGLGAGLEFELFKPGQERNADFYMELPIQIKVIGGFHDFGSFVSGISDLPRIVTTHNIDISEQDEGVLTMNMTAKTYRYVDEEG